MSRIIQARNGSRVIDTMSGGSGNSSDRGEITERQCKTANILQALERMLVQTGANGWHGTATIKVFVENGVPVRFVVSPEQSVRL